MYRSGLRSRRKGPSRPRIPDICSEAPEDGADGSRYPSEIDPSIGLDTGWVSDPTTRALRDVLTCGLREYELDANWGQVCAKDRHTYPGDFEVPRSSKDDPEYFHG